MEISISKSLLRKTILQYRRMMDQKVFEERNAELLKQLQNLVEAEDTKVIHTFLPIKRNREVDVTSLFPRWEEQGRKLVVSKTDFKIRKMSHFFLDHETELKENTIGIPEPVNAQEADFGNVDLILVPLLAFDNQKNRIGYGGGYYDQLLAETKAMKVGLSLSPPLDHIIQKEEWDVTLDHIISYK